MDEQTKALIEAARQDERDKCVKLCQKVVQRLECYEAKYAAGGARDCVRVLITGKMP